MISIQSKVLKELVTEYKLANEEDRKSVFCVILARIDKLIIGRVHKLKRIKRELRNVESQDLYHSAIIGLYRGINSAKDQDSGDRIQARILSYVNEQIRVTYLGKKRRLKTIDPQFISHMEDLNTESMDIKYPKTMGSGSNLYMRIFECGIESNELIDKTMELVESGEVSRDDFNLLIEHAIHGKSYSEIGRNRGIRYQTVSKRINRLRSSILEKLKLDDD